MTNTSWLPRVLRWIFTICAVFTALGAVIIGIVLLIDPSLPPGTHFGPTNVDIMGEPGTFVMQSNSDVTLTTLRGTVILSVQGAGGFIEVLKHYGLPLILIKAIFLTVLFDLLRRLFRNVGRGESFTPQSIRLVQAVGLSLIVFSIAMAFAGDWFLHAVYAYLAQHATATISGTTIHLPASHEITISSEDAIGGPTFFSGLLVLALSEVFRQGLVLKRENDLTV